MSLDPARFGLRGAADAVRMSFLTVGLWWACFSLPLMVLVREERLPSPGLGTMVSQGISELRKTFHEIRHLKTIAVFLLAYWLYIDGVGTIIVMAVDYGSLWAFPGTTSWRRCSWCSSSASPAPSSSGGSPDHRA
jgi:UMF1 family MFS transporter